MQVFEAPEVETQQKVSVLEEAVAASEHGKEPSGWFPPPEHTQRKYTWVNLRVIVPFKPSHRSTWPV